jgi:glycosyltransferase involved in cell wall biosynthesis
MLTVLLATRNRSKILRSVLESFTKLQKPRSGWKLVIVDNGSSDETSEVVVSYAERLPLQFRTEVKQGKNFALNAGLELVEGDLTVLTDDDVFPQEDWLIQLCGAAEAHPEFSIFGGSIAPHWEVAPPKWIQWTDQGAVYARTDPRWVDGPIAASGVWGPNMAIRSCIFESGIRFDTDIGPRGSNYVQGGETELTRRLENLGHKAWHVRDAVVRHFIRREQLEKGWVMRRAIRYGRGEFRLEEVEDLRTRRLLLGVPGHLFREFYEEAWSMTKAWLNGQQEGCFRSHWQMNYILGKIQEARKISRACISGVCSDMPAQ